MDIQALTQYFLQYGAVFIFVIVLLEYLNLPGFPAGVIMPLAGIWAAKGQIGLGMALLLALVAGMLGSWILYGLGRLGGHMLLEKYLKKFPAQRPVIEKNFAMLERSGRNLCQQADSHGQNCDIYSGRCDPHEFYQIQRKLGTWHFCMELFPDRGRLLAR